MAPRTVRIRRFWLVSGSLGLTALLLYLLFDRTAFSARDAAEALTGVPPWLGALILLSSTVQMAAGAAKWRMTSRRLLPLAAGAGPGFFFFYTSLGGVLGQVMPLHFSSALARASAVKLHHGESAVRGAVSSAFEQAFDLVVPALLTLATLASLLAGGDLRLWLAAAALLLLGGTLALEVSGDALALGLQRLLTRLALRLPFLRPAARGLRSARGLGLMHGGYLRRMMMLSVVRYAAHVVRAVLVAWSLGLQASAADIVQIMPLVQIALLLALTPGSLGIAEWSWVGLLVLTGMDLESAGLFAVMHRILMFCSLGGVLLIAALVYAGEGRVARRGLREPSS